MQRIKNYSKKILILVPNATAQGGISNYYQILKHIFSPNVNYFVRGSRTFPFRKNSIAESYRFIKDIFKFVFIMNFKSYNLIQTTTSFTPNSIIRDSIFVLLAKTFRKKVIIFFRGWDESYVNSLTKKQLKWFKRIYFKSDAIIDLADKNIRKIKNWGYKGKCYVETTAVDRNMMQSINEDFIYNKYSSDKHYFTILFLARIEIEKGIYETIEAFKLIKQRYKQVKLIIAGDGIEKVNVCKKIEDEGLCDVIIKGFVTGIDKIDVLKGSGIYILPSYREGLPGSVLEAMAFGLPIITTNVGGIPDIFENNKNGFITSSIEPKILAELIEKLLRNKQLMNKMSIYNYKYAKSRFWSNIVVQRIEKIYADILESNL